MRGKLANLDKSYNTFRITPACAGKTRMLFRYYDISEDHPRVCGENNYRSWYNRGKRGSPPRVRGKLSLTIRLLTIVRITPACAGKTMKEIARISVNEDHPRVCGENCGEDYFIGLGQGSPPRVRGKHVPGLHFLLTHRITPACAGKTNDV